MPASVPTMDEFNALEARVAALEGSSMPPDPPDPPDPQPGDGVQAKRIGADLIELFGTNTFSSLDQSNLWGSWPADYSPESVIDALRFCFPPECGFSPRVREYHYAGREQMQTEWLTKVRAAYPKLRTTVCVGAGGDVGDINTMLEMQADVSLGIDWLEGLNEPNTAFYGPGSEVPVEVTMAIQRALYDGGAKGLMGPSVVAGTPHPEGWIEGYFEEQMDDVNALMTYGNGHYYPPHCPCVPNTGYSLDEYIGGLWGVYAQHLIHLTEFHPTLFAAGTLAVERRIGFLAGRLKDEPPIPEFHANADRDAYYTLMSLLNCAKTGVGLWWYALYDYGSTYECGLFPTRHADDPRPVAHALRNLCLICADPGDHGFTPGRLAFSVDAIPDHCDWSLFQASDGRYMIALWNAQEDLGSDPVDVTLRFDPAPTAVSEYDPLQGTTAIRGTDGPATYVCRLPGGVRILEVTL